MNHFNYGIIIGAIESAPLLGAYGVTILGDYEDLSALRDALYYYTELFLSNQDHPDAYDCQQSILGLCYDIRHAYQGDRDFEAVPNNAENIAMLAECIYETDPISMESIESNREVFGHGNLYFSVDIVYPWAIYYLYVLQAITDIPCDQSWFEKLDYPYDEYRAEHDMALIQYFVQLLWGCVKTVLPPRVFKALWDYTRTFSHTDYYISCPDCKRQILGRIVSFLDLPYNCRKIDIGSFYYNENFAKKLH